MTVRELRERLQALSGDIEVRAVYLGTHYEPSVSLVTPWHEGEKEVLFFTNGKRIEVAP